MRTKYLLVAIAVGTAVAMPAAAQNREIEYPKGSLAYDALMSADYARAEKLLRSSNRIAYNDPAKLINYGLLLAKTGRLEAARESFEQALHEEEIELIMADGSSESSHDVARRGLAMIK